MKLAITPRYIAVWFVIVLAVYLASFHGIEYLNHRKGPWEVSFMADAQGNPAIVAYQPRLDISSVEILFSGEKVPQTNLSQRVVFDRPLREVPFGKVIYADLRTLPGVVTFDLFGHEIELLPRVLIVNKKEIPWKSEMNIELSVTNKPARPPKPPKDAAR
jgi:hypothetical protein